MWVRLDFYLVEAHLETMTGVELAHLERISEDQA
jgi:hypothetical protein